jgi:hypothetical protein
VAACSGARGSEQAARKSSLVNLRSEVLRPSALREFVTILSVLIAPRRSADRY